MQNAISGNTTRGCWECRFWSPICRRIKMNRKNCCLVLVCNDIVISSEPSILPRIDAKPRTIPKPLIFKMQNQFYIKQITKTNFGQPISGLSNR